MCKFSRSTILLAAASAAIVGIGLVAGPALATPTTGWLQTATGTYDYNNTANWVGGTINGIWDSSLTLSANQTVTIGATPAVQTGLTFNFAGGKTLLLENTGGSQTFDLLAGAGITMTPAASETVNINSASNTSILTIDLGGGNQVITNHAASGNAYLNIGAVLTDGSITTASNDSFLTISGVNTYAGSTTLGGGVFAVTTIANGGLASGLGESSNLASNLVFTGSAQLRYAGTTAASTDRLFTLGASGANIAASASGALTFSNTNSLAFSATDTAHTLSLASSSKGSLTFDPLITNDGTGVTSVNVQGNGATGSFVELANTGNSYTGSTSMAFYYPNGTLVVTSLANGGTDSSIGASSSAASNLVFSAGSGLEYTGTGSATDRNFTVNYAAPGKVTATNIFTIDNAGTGALVMTGAQTYAYNYNGSSTEGTGNTISTMGMVLDGSNPASQVNQYNGAIVNGVTPGTSPTYFVTALYTVTKSGSNTWDLGGTNTYTGATTVNGGALLITGSLASGSAVAVNSGGTLGGGGTIGGSVTLATGGTLAPSFDSATPTTLIVGSLSAGAGSTIDLNISGAANDSVTVTTSGGLTYGGTLAITDAVPQLGSYQLFSFTGSPTSDFAAASVNGNALADSSGTWTGTIGLYNYTFTDSTGVLAVTGSAIPEPATLGVMAVMGVGLLLVGRKRKVA